MSARIKLTDAERKQAALAKEVARWEQATLNGYHGPRCTIEWPEDHPGICRIFAEEVFNPNWHKSDRVEADGIVRKDAFLRETRPQDRNLQYMAGYAEGLFKLVDDSRNDILAAIGFENVSAEHPGECYNPDQEEDGVIRKIAERDENGMIISIEYEDGRATQYQAILLGERRRLADRRAAT